MQTNKFAISLFWTLLINCQTGFKYIGGLGSMSSRVLFSQPNRMLQHMKRSKSFNNGKSFLKAENFPEGHHLSSQWLTSLHNNRLIKNTLRNYLRFVAVKQGTSTTQSISLTDIITKQHDTSQATSISTCKSMKYWDTINNERFKRENRVVPSEALTVATKQAELQKLLQQFYQSQAIVKMESLEIARTQQVVEEAQDVLEEATNKVRMLSAALQSAQEGAAAAAVRAHTAHLHLSAHDQLMFNARQQVNDISSRMVSVQADLTSAQEAFTLNNSSRLLEQQGRPQETPSVASLFCQNLSGHPISPAQSRYFPTGPKQISSLAYPFSYD